MQQFKFGRALADGDAVAHEYPNRYEWQRTTGPARLLIGPRTRPVELLYELSRCWRGPFWVLYVLSVPRTEASLGRYQSPAPLSSFELLRFLARHRRFLEGDARHSLWVASASGEGTLVYDRHDLLYAYGPLEQFEDVLTAHGITRGEVPIPVPHTHHYWPEYDAAETSLLGELAWVHTPLQAGDEN